MQKGLGAAAPAPDVNYPYSSSVNDLNLAPDYRPDKRSTHEKVPREDAQTLLRWAAMALSVGAFVAGCSSATGSDGSQAKGSPNSDITIGAITNQPNAFFQQVQQGMQSEAGKKGVHLIVVSDGTSSGGTNPTAEAQDIQEFITRKVNAILISTLSPSGASITNVRDAVKAGIPVVCYNGCLGATDTSTDGLASGIVQSSGVQLGRSSGLAAAAYIRKYLGGKAIIGELNCDEFSVCKLRRTTFNETLAQQGIKATYVANQFGQLSAGQSLSTATDVLNSHPNINVMFAAFEEPTFAAYKAIQQTGRNGKVVVFGVDIDADIANAVLHDPPTLIASAGQDAQGIGAKSVDMAIMAANHKKIRPSSVDVPPILYSRSNPSVVRSYLKAVG